MTESVDAAVALLREVIADLQGRGRTTMAAGIKPQLQRRSPGFDEQQLGFEKFSEFLQYAAQKGAVELDRSRGQLVVMLPGSTALEPVAAVRRRGSARRRPHIRPDLWEAFTNWGDYWRRAWDKEQQVAVRVPLSPAEGEDPSTTSLRTLLDEQSERFVPIDGIPETEQVEWMREFAEAQGGRMGLLLRYAIKEEERKAHAFSQAAREEPAVYARWTDMRVQKVLDAIAAWKLEHDIDVDPCVAARANDESERSVAAVTVSDEPAMRADLTEAQLRELVRAAVEHMTYSELLALPIQLQHVVRCRA
jgi:hypothetical protein